MFLEAIIAATAIALVSMVGVVVFGSHRGLVGIERFVIPVAVGVFLSLVLYELIPETVAHSPEWGGVVVAIGYVSFYILAQYLHQYFHRIGTDDCKRRSSAMLLLIGDAFHNMSDGLILGSAFIVDPSLGVVTAIALAVHELPQEIVEFGVLIRAGYTRTQAVVRNLLSASTVIIGTVLVIVVSEHSADWVWVLTGLAAGNLLFLAASDLLPRIHGNLEDYGSVWYATVAIITGFILMTVVINWSHSQFDMEHAHEHVGVASVTVG